MQVSALGADGRDFDQAYHQSLTTGRPLVVLIGARWCPACQKMKNAILPQVAKTGGLERVVFNYVDFDQQRQLASRLSRGSSIPQLIRFDRTAAGWKSKYLVGARSPREVHDFVNAGLLEESEVSKVSATSRPKSDYRKRAAKPSVRSTPAASNSRTYASVRATGSRRSEAGSSQGEKAADFSRWMVFFKRLFR
jgi:thiol-disulfide isomerase/thioredoxin